MININYLRLASGICFLIASFFFFLGVLHGGTYFILVPAIACLILGVFRIADAFNIYSDKLQATDVKVELVKREDYNK
jgi:hypothetical protein